MRINDIVLENKIAEAPQGMLKRAGLGIMSKFGSDKAAGKLDTGRIANLLMRDFNRFLGQTKLEPDADAVLRFLQSKGYPSDGAKSILDQEASAPSGPMGGGPIGKMAGAAMDKLKSLGQGGTENPRAQNKIDPTMDEPGSDADGDGKPDVAGGMSKAGQDAAADGKPDVAGGMSKAGQDAAADKPDPLDRMKNLAGLPTSISGTATASHSGEYSGPKGYGAQTYGTNTHFDPTTMKNVSTPMDPKNIGTVNIPNTTTPAADTEIPPTKAPRQTVGQKVAAQLADKEAKKSRFRNKPLKQDMYTEAALPQGVIDKAFMQAAHDAAKMGYGLDPNTGNITKSAPQGPNASGGQDQSQGVGGSFISGVMKGAGIAKPGTADPNAEKQGTLNVQQLSQILPGVDPAKLKQATNMALSGGRLGPGQLGILGQAFVELLKADPQATTKAMAILKRVQA